MSISEEGAACSLRSMECGHVHVSKLPALLKDESSVPMSMRRRMVKVPSRQRQSSPSLPPEAGNAGFGGAPCSVGAAVPLSALWQAAGTSLGHTVADSKVFGHPGAVST